MEYVKRLKQAQYTGIKVTSMIRALQHSSIICHLLLKRRNKLSEIDNNYRVNGFINSSEMYIVWKLYYNFVLNDYRDNTPNF